MISRSRLGTKLRGRRWQCCRCSLTSFLGFCGITNRSVRLLDRVQHRIYEKFGYRLPCTSAGENPNNDPMVGTRSVGSTGWSKTTPSRIPRLQPASRLYAKAHPRAMMLESVAAGILVGIAAKSGRIKGCINPRILARSGSSSIIKTAERSVRRIALYV